MSSDKFIVRYLNQKHQNISLHISILGHDSVATVTWNLCMIDIINLLCR
jgi:hypothetical protein